MGFRKEGSPAAREGDLGGLSAGIAGGFTAMLLVLPGDEHQLAQDL